MIAAALIQSVYALLTAIAVGFELVPWTREAFVKYGRTRSARPKAQGRPSRGAQIISRAPWLAAALEWFAATTVPKNWFSQFYWTGAAVGGLVLLDTVLWLWRSRSYSPGLQEPAPCFVFAAAALLERWIGRAPQAAPTAIGSRGLAAVAGLTMYSIHIVVRLKETVCDQPISSARMHIGQYAVGMVFYIVTPLAVVVDAHCAHIWRPVSMWVFMAATVLFAFASLHQWRCHHILFQLRSMKLQRSSEQPQIAGAYALPSGDLFEYVSSPHYLCEILVYISLWMATGFQAPTLLAVVVWSAANLGITARESQLWYRKTFGEQFPQHRRALVPWVW